MRQGLAVALPAVRRQEIDAAFGRVHDLPGPWPPELAYQLVHVEPLSVFIGEEHELASRSALRLVDLRRCGIAMPDPGGSTEWRGYLTRLASTFDIPLRFTAPAAGQRHLVEQLLREKTAVGIGEAAIDPAGSGLRRIPIVDPTPLHPWSIVWHRQNRNPLLHRLLRHVGTPALPRPTDTGYWIPDIDFLPA